MGRHDVELSQCLPATLGREKFDLALLYLYQHECAGVGGMLSMFCDTKMSIAGVRQSWGWSQAKKRGRYIVDKRLYESKL
jgi:hypothetical protein